MKKILCAAILLATLSCKKKNEEVINTTTPSKEQLAGSYKQTAETVNGANTWTTANNQHMACEMDDVYNLSANNTYSYTDAGTTCSGSSGYNGTWFINGDKFVMDGDTMTVLGFNGRELQLRTTDHFGSMTYLIDATFTRQ